MDGLTEGTAFARCKMTALPVHVSANHIRRPCDGAKEHEVDPSVLSPPAIPPVPVVLVHLEECRAARAGHEVGTLRELARQIAELKGTGVAGEFDPTLTCAAHRYLIPDTR